MESKELMLGNWVAAEDGRYGTIRENRGEAGVLIKFTGSSLITRKPQPILITPEILEMAGWRKWNKEDEAYMDGRCEFEIKPNRNKWSLYAFCETDGTKWHLRDLSYVHELQNICTILVYTHLKIELK